MMGMIFTSRAPESKGLSFMTGHISGHHCSVAMLAIIGELFVKEVNLGLHVTSK